MKKTFFSIVILFLVSSITIAQTPENKLLGDTTLPSSKEELAKLASFEKGIYNYSVEDYFRKPNKTSFKLSPNGTYLSFKQKDKQGKSHIYIKNTKTNETSLVIKEKDQLIVTYYWGNNNTILYAMDKGGNENYHLYSYNIDTKKDMDLTPFEGVTLSTIYALKDLPKYVIVPLNKRNKQIFEPYKINIETGEMELVYENIDSSNPINSYKFDSKGNLRALTRRKNGVDNIIDYKAIGEDTFKEIINTNWKETFTILNFVSEDSDLAYVLTNLDSDKEEVVLYNLKNKKVVERLFSNPDYDIYDISLSKKRNNELDSYSYNGEKDVTVPVSDRFKKVYNVFKKQFAPNQFSIANVTDNEDKYLIYVSSDVLYGTYYQYDVKTDSFKLLEDLMPQLNPNDMAEMRPIKFKSRDGLTIYGYLTIPNQAKEGEKAPLIVNPHGGPYGERDSWGFNPESQLFASRGYATLQINYRGSGGYGKAFYLSGSKQIGRKMLNDLEDAVAYVKTLNLIDKDKIAIYGASYGGLATLGSLVKTPDLYSCGVDYVGVSNLFTFVQSFPPYWKPLMKQFYEQWYDEENEDEKKIMKDVSPALNVEQITKPLFVVQGANDPRVNIDESDQIVINLRERGFDVPYMVKYNEGHGFDHEKNRIELYKTMMGFFAKHLKE